MAVEGVMVNSIGLRTGVTRRMDLAISWGRGEGWSRFGCSSGAKYENYGELRSAV